MAQLRWVSGDDPEAFVEVGEFTTRAEALEAVPGVLAEMLRQCADDDECKEVRAGSFYYDGKRCEIGDTFTTNGQVDTTRAPRLS